MTGREGALLQASGVRLASSSATMHRSSPVLQPFPHFLLYLMFVRQTGGP